VTKQNDPSYGWTIEKTANIKLTSSQKDNQPMGLCDKVGPREVPNQLLVANLSPI